jgi:hypothetical protein
MFKFLSLPDVKSVIACEKAEALLNEAREMNKCEIHKDKTDTDLLKELTTKFMQNHENTAMSVKQYHDSLLADQRSRHMLWQNMERFLRLEAAGRYFMEGNQVQLSMTETLEGFAAENSPDMSTNACLERIKEAGHLPLVHACADLFFIRSNPKKRLVWIHGPRNTGKSTFIELMETIFAAQQFNFKQVYCTMD